MGIYDVILVVIAPMSTEEKKLAAFIAVRYCAKLDRDRIRDPL